METKEKEKKRKEQDSHNSMTIMISFGVSYTSCNRTTRGDCEQRDNRAISCLNSALQSALNLFLDEYFAA